MKKMSTKLHLSILGIIILYKRSLLLVIISFYATILAGQKKVLSLQQQIEDFTILTEVLRKDTPVYTTISTIRLFNANVIV